MTKLKSEAGIQESLWLSHDLVDIVDQVRKKLGMTKSAFYRYATLRLLEEMSVLSTKVKEDLVNETKNDACMQGETRCRSRRFSKE